MSGNGEHEEGNDRWLPVSACGPGRRGGSRRGGAGEGPKGRAEGDARCRRSYLPRLLPTGRARPPFRLPLHPAQCSPCSWLELRTPPVPGPGGLLGLLWLLPPSPLPLTAQAAPSFPPALGTSHMLFPLPRIFSTLSFFFFPYPNFTQILSLNVACLSSAPAPLYSSMPPIVEVRSLNVCAPGFLF